MLIQCCFCPVYKLHKIRNGIIHIVPFLSIHTHTFLSFKPATLATSAFPFRNRIIAADFLSALKTAKPVTNIPITITIGCSI